ncbi:MAG: DNA alkylation repair protein [Candidatus Aminicenantes bacterium]|nr:DNA alkylation repair protein [Candidatus Aminicenantes bacterium]
MDAVNEIIDKLKEKARPEQLAGMKRFGMATEQRLGVRIPDLRKMAKEIGKNHELALELWQTPIDEARILAGMIAEPQKLTGRQMENWVKDFNSWDVCDQVCMNLFDKTPLPLFEKIHDWSQRHEEYVKRAGFALIASLARHDKKMADEKFVALFSLIKNGAADERNFVKKAVNWALRNIGKRNPQLNRLALEVAYEMRQSDSKSARWIAADAVRELESDAVQRRLKNRQ